MREFIIQASGTYTSSPLVVYEDDVFGVIGELLRLVSCLDEGDSVQITCSCQDVEMRGDE